MIRSILGIFLILGSCGGWEVGSMSFLSAIACSLFGLFLTLWSLHDKVTG